MIPRDPTHRMRRRVYVCEYCGRRDKVQRGYVEHFLRHRGERGGHTFELRARGIANPSERVADLERAGRLVAHRREPLGGEANGVRYFLLADVVASPAAAKPWEGGPHRSTSGAGHETGDWGWRRSWWCERCCDMKAAGPVCANGHETRLGWLLDLTDPQVLYEIEDHLAAAEIPDDLPVAA